MHNESLIMHFKIKLFLSVFCCLVIGCTSVPDELKIAEKIMEANPDSAYMILQRLTPEKFTTNSNRALYGLLLIHSFEINDRNDRLDSLINFSIKYYLNKNDNYHLASCYFYKGHMLKHAQLYDEATVLYLKSLDCLKKFTDTDNDLLGKIYSDMGDINSMQSDYKESLNKYKSSLNCFHKAQNKVAEKFIILSIGRTYHFLRDYNTAQHYYQTALINSNDSLLSGSVYQEMGSNFYWDKQLDSAQYYLRKSLLYPFRSTGFAIRNYNLSDLLFDLEKYDSSFIYATIALKYPANFYTQRDCYRILVNVEYTRKDIKQMGIYMRHYQDCTDSIQKIKSQTKATVLENLHKTNQEVDDTKSKMILIVSSLLIILLISTALVIFLYARNKLKREQLQVFKQQLNIKQEFVSQRLTAKIEEIRALQTEDRKCALPDERDQLDKELYYSVLHLDSWDLFKREMNHAFNNIVVTLNSEYPSITQKEITWCCLHLLDIPHADRMLLLEATSDSLYKLKQRLAHKLNLKTTKEFDCFLKELTAIKD